MATRKQGFVYPNPAIKEGSVVHLHLVVYAQTRNLSLGQAINAILGDWADALDGKPSPFGSPVILGGTATSTGLTEEQRHQHEREDQARDQRVASTASQWL